MGMRDGSTLTDEDEDEEGDEEEEESRMDGETT